MWGLVRWHVSVCVRATPTTFDFRQWLRYGWTMTVSKYKKQEPTDTIETALESLGLSGRDVVSFPNFDWVWDDRWHAFESAVPPEDGSVHVVPIRGRYPITSVRVKVTADTSKLDESVLAAAREINAGVNADCPYRSVACDFVYEFDNEPTEAGTEGFIVDGDGYRAEYFASMEDVTEHIKGQASEFLDREFRVWNVVGGHTVKVKKTPVRWLFEFVVTLDESVFINTGWVFIH